jgi:hypothetical protein
MTEDRGRDSLEAHIRRLMKDLGLWGYHPRRSERSEKGWPDWAIIGTRIIYRELKTERGKVTPEQQAVGERIRAAGGDWAVWRPRHLLSGCIARELQAITPGPLGLAQRRLPEDTQDAAPGPQRRAETRTGGDAA